MQKMLTWLVVFLTVAVGGLGVLTLRLYMEERGADPRLAPPSTAPRGGVSEAALDPARVEMMERRLSKLLEESESQRRQIAILSGALDAARASAGGSIPSIGGGGSDVEGDTPPDPLDSPTVWAPERAADGSYAVSEADEEFFLAVQARVESRRRAEGLARNVMRRIERLASRGEIGALPEETLKNVEKVVRGYVGAGDELVTRYVRSPTEEVVAWSAEQRRDAMQVERDALVQRAYSALEPLLGAADALKVAEESLQNPWGLRARESMERRNKPPGDRGAR